MARIGQGEDDAELIPPVPASELFYTEDDVLVLGSQRRPPTWMVVAAVGVLLSGVIALAAVKRASQRAAAPTPSVIAPEVAPAMGQALPYGTPLDLGQTSAVDLTLASGRLFVLTAGPPRLGQVNARTGTLDRQVPAPAGATSLVVDDAGGLAWVVADDRVFAYDAPTLGPIGQIDITRRVSVAAALDGRLFVGTDRGIYMAEPRHPAPTLLPGFSGQLLQAMAADPARHRLLAVTVTYQLLEVTTRRVHIVRELSTQLPASILVTNAGIWAVGFGQPGGSRIARLDPRSLQITPVGVGDDDAPQGAEGWAGESVIWTRFPFIGSITCRNARSGVIVASFSNAIGRVVSRRGMAYGLSGGLVLRLPTTPACPG